MQVEFSKDFLKSIKKLDQSLRRRITKVVESFEQSSDILSISNVKKLEGYNNLYRVRIGDYRLIFRLKPDLVIVLVFLHRKDVYKKLDDL